MHRAYQPITPANNKLLRKRWDEYSFQFHRKMVDTAAPMIDNKPPKTYMHLHLKLKNLQLEEQRIAEVERDNRILLEKMSYIMRTKGIVDNRNDYQQKSLNKAKRQRELLRLSHDNQAILRRIQSKESFYKQSEWEEHHRTQQKYLDNITKYPKYWHKRRSAKLKPISRASATPEDSRRKSEAKEEESKPTVEEQKTEEEKEEGAVENENEESPKKEEPPEESPEESAEASPEDADESHEKET